MFDGQSMHIILIDFYLQQEAENRKKHLVELLDEHAQIVHQVEVAIETEATTESIDDKENSVNHVTER